MPSAERIVLRHLLELALSFDGAILGLTLAFAAVDSVIKYASNSAALKKIKEAPEVSVSDLRSLIPSSEHQSETSDQRIFVVRGTVRPKFSDDERKHNVLISPETGYKALIIQRTQTYMFTRRMTLLGFDRFLLERSMPEVGADFMRMVPFVIVDKNHHQPSSFLVVNMDSSKQPLPFTTVFTRLQPIDWSPYSFLKAFWLPEYPVGLLDVEKILPPGRDLTAVGTCSFNNGVPEIKSCQDLPYFLSEMTKDKMILNLTDETRIIFWGSVIMGCLSVGILSFAAVRIWNKWKLRNHQRELAHISNLYTTDGEAAEDTEEISDGELCVICLTRRRIPAFVPCGHIVCCSECAFIVERAVNSRCPVYLQSIRGSMRVYYS